MGIRLSNVAATTGVMTLVAQKNFASNAVTFSGLSGDYRYRLYLSVTVVDTTSGDLELNGDTDPTHYRAELCQFSGGGVVAAAINDNQVLYSTAGGGLVIIDFLRNNSGYLMYRAEMISPSTASVVMQWWGGSKADATAAEITSIKILKDAVGTSITGTATLYKLGV